MFGLLDAHQRDAEKTEKDHVFDRPEALVQAPGQRPLRNAQLARDLVGQFLQGAEGAEPAAIGAPTPEKQRGGNGKPKDKGQRIQQERLPAEAVHQAAEQCHQVDDRKLRIGVPAEKDQCECQEDNTEDIKALGVLDRISLEEEHACQHHQHGGENHDLQLGIAPDAFPEICLRAHLFLR